jgi:hypothetical protein
MGIHRLDRWIGWDRIQPGGIGRRRIQIRGLRMYTDSHNAPSNRDPRSEIQRPRSFDTPSLCRFST